MTRSRLVFPIYAAAEGLSFFGNSAIQIVLPWLVLVRTGDPAAAGVVAAAAGIAQIAATLAIGQLIDRFGARRMAVIADVGSAASVAALATVDAAFGLTLGARGRGCPVRHPRHDRATDDDAARRAAQRSAAQRSGMMLDTVAAVRQSIFGVSFLAGPALAGPLLAVFDPGQVLWITAACSALAAIATLGIRVPPVGADNAASGMLGAWRTVRGLPVVIKLFVVAGMSSLISAPLLSVLLPAHFASLDRPDLLGFTMSAFAVGIFAGSAAYALLAKLSRRTAWTTALVATTAGLMLMATLDGFGLVVIGAVAVGVGSGIINPIFGVVIAERVPGSQLGRVMGLTSAVSLSAGPLGLGIATVILTTGTLPVLAWGIVIAWLFMAVMGAIGPSLRDLEPPETADDKDGMQRTEEAADAHH